jgi:hypothetical protein
MIDTFPETSSVTYGSNSIALSCYVLLTILEDRTIRQIDPGALVRNDDDSSAKRNLAAKPHVASNSQVVKLEDVGDSTEALLEVGNLRRRV